MMMVMMMMISMSKEGQDEKVKELKVQFNTLKVGVVECCWMLLDVVEGFWMLLDVVECF